MSNPQANSDTQATAATNGMPPLSTEETSQLPLASSLSATRPLIGLIRFLINEGILDGGKLKSFLTPMLVTDGFPPATKACWIRSGSRCSISSTIPREVRLCKMKRVA
jgi:hypothetical protein